MNVLSSLYIIFSWNLALTKALTYDLKFDGIVSPRLLSMGIHENVSEISTEVAKAFSVDIGNEAVLLWKAQDGSVKGLGDIALNEICHVQESYGSAPHGVSCGIHHVSKNISMDISLKLSCIVDSDGKSITSSFDGKDLFLVGVRIDVSLSAPQTKGREILTALVPKINEVIHYSDLTDYSFPVWNIQARPNHLELLEMHKKLQQSDVSNDISYLDSIKQSSLESNILSNNMFMEKKLMQEIAVKNKREFYKVWQYSQPGSKDRTITSLFIKSKLRYTTTFAGTALAEAMIHPALISHPNPYNVAVFSDFPSAYLHEILKHKNVETVDVYTISDVVDMTEKFFPELNDCGDFDNRASKCFDSEGVTLLEWDDFDSLDQNYDVMFLDITDSESWSNYEMKELFEVMDDDGILVLNAGSVPSMDTIIHEDISKEDYRSEFIHRVTRLISKGGHEEGLVHVYDEPKAEPLDSTFIMVSADMTEAEVYRRFVRRNSAAFDLDMAYRMSQSSKSHVITKLYDGATHLSYIRPSRLWENWTCQKKPWKYMDHCVDLLPKLYNPKYHVNELNVVLDPIKGRTTKALENIPEGHIVLPNDGLVSMFFDEDNYKHFKKFVQQVPSAMLYKQVLDVIDGYGFEISSYGFTGYVCSLANNTFMNHACSAEELNAGPMESLQFDEDGDSITYFNPIATRHAEFFGVHTVTLRDIKKGEELLMDYRHLRINKMLRESEIGMCEGEGIIPIDQEKDPNVGHHRRSEEL